MASEWIKQNAQKSLERLIPRIKRQMMDAPGFDTASWRDFETRLSREFAGLFELLLDLYGGHYDFFYHLEMLIAAAAGSWMARNPELKALDAEREARPDWFQSQEMVGGVLYVDLFSDNLQGLGKHIDYFKELGLTYLHLMPIFAVPRGNSDGGYAVSDYRAVNPEIGTMEELAEVATRLRRKGISLVLDFVFNHTSDEHVWARRAAEGDPEYREFYHIFPNREMPDQYERHLRDIFPTVRKGSFTWHQAMGKWVWTTFNNFQWDLNYANPAVFRAMVEEMLFLANTGVEVLRLDAVAFIWKRLGTDCENQPEAHKIIRAFNAVARMAAPGLLFKSEAIVHPDEVIRYIDGRECQLSYNPMLMALLWEALATREVRLLELAMRNRSRIPNDCAWVNYLRCHDDIGWTFDDNDARTIGLDPGAHRHFLNEFYTGQFPGSFARGLPFQFNPENGDLRISGTLASLAGLEQAVQEADPLLIDMAVRRIILLRSIVLSAGGIPLIYIGEEWGLLNDYSFASDEAKVGDNRWVHRPKTRWHQMDAWKDPQSLEWRIYDETARLIRLRKGLQAFYNGGMEVIATHNAHLFGYVRQKNGHRILAVHNFSDQAQSMEENRLRLYGPGYRFVDHVTGNTHTAIQPLYLTPYQFLWLEHQGD